MNLKYRSSRLQNILCANYQRYPMNKVERVLVLVVFLVQIVITTKQKKLPGAIMRGNVACQTIKRVNGRISIVRTLACTLSVSGVLKLSLLSPFCPWICFSTSTRAANLNLSPLFTRKNIDELPGVHHTPEMHPRNLVCVLIFSRRSIRFPVGPVGYKYKFQVHLSQNESFLEWC